MCAPRPTFISYGVPERGDARWLEQQGSYMAAVAAGPVFRLLGARDLGTSDDYMEEKAGVAAARRRPYRRPNWKYFIPWAARMLATP